MVQKRHTSLGVLAALLGISTATASSARINPTSKTSPITIGVSHVVNSAVLGENRTVNVVLPASYGKEPLRRYPVLYLIDGGLQQDLLHVAGVVHLGALWGRSAEAIVVGLETNDRRKELVGQTSDPDLLKRYPTAGSSHKFREFVRSEIMPLIETTYRSNGRNVVLGESLAGLFVVETYVLEPSLFQAYAAVDPSLWWDKERLSKNAGVRIGLGQKGRPLFLAIAKEQVEYAAASNRLISAFRTRGLTLCAVAKPDLTHTIIYQQLAPQAVQYLLPPAEGPPPEYGFTIECPEKT
jgi:predicted alpha/beta superfamily hydrolase